MSDKEDGDVGHGESTNRHRIASLTECQRSVITHDGSHTTTSGEYNTLSIFEINECATA